MGATTALRLPFIDSLPEARLGVPLAPASISPPLKWAGGKRWQLPRLRSLWTGHAHRRLVEPFCGSLSVSLGLAPRAALVNDVNVHLVNFYRWVQRGLTIEIALENDEAAFYRNRERFNALLRDGQAESSEAAALFYYLNRTGFNGLCRFNRSGFFNVPFGRYTKISYQRSFPDVQVALSGYELRCEPFESLRLAATDFVYADPPYDVPFTTYSAGGFAWADQERTAAWLAAHPGPVVLVNQATPRIRELYGSLGFELTELDAPRRISCTGDRTPAREVLATRNLGSPNGAR